MSVPSLWRSGAGATGKTTRRPQIVKLAIGTGKPGVPFSSSAVVDAVTPAAGWATVPSARGASSCIIADVRGSATGSCRATGRFFGVGCVATARAFAAARTGVVLALKVFGFAAADFATLGFSAAGRRFAAARTRPAAIVLPFAFGMAARFASVVRAAFFAGLRFTAMTA